MAKNLSGFLDAVQKWHPKGLIRISDAFDPNRFEVAALAHQLEQQGSTSALLFERVKNVRGEDSEFPLLMNLFASRELCSLAIGHPPEDSRMGLVQAFAEIERQPGEIEVIASSAAPAQEVVWPEAELDVRRFPVPYYHQDDVGQYFVMTDIMKSRDGSFYDVTFTKNLIFDERHLSISAHEHHHLDRMIQEYEAHGEKAPIVIVLGIHPAFYMSSCALMPYGNDDYATASAFLHEPLRLVPSQTWGEEFLVPADAEIIIEGYVMPGERKYQNPFGEISGHYQEPKLMPVMEVTAVTHRRGAIFQGVMPGHREHWLLGGIPKEGSIYNAIQKLVPKISAVNLPMSGCGRFSCFLSFKPGHLSSDITKAAMTAFSSMPNLKLCVAVDDEIDVYNEREVFWAVATQTWWDRDLTVIPKVQSFRAWLGDAVALIDATRPAREDFPKHNQIPADALERVDITKYL